LTDAGGGTVLPSLLLQEALTPKLFLVLRIAFSAHTKRDEPNRFSNEEEEEEILVGNESNSGATNCIGKKKNFRFFLFLLLERPQAHHANYEQKKNTKTKRNNTYTIKVSPQFFSFPSRNQTPKEIDEKQSAKQQ
jgi:hypothetical protein